MENFQPQALMPELHVAQAANAVANIAIPNMGMVNGVDAKVHKDGFGNGTDYSRHEEKKATNLFKIKFTYSKNRSALVTANPFLMAARSLKKAADEVKKRADQKIYSKQNLVVQADESVLEQFEIKTRFVVPFELTFDLTPFSRIPARPYELYKIDRAGAAQRANKENEPDAPFPPYTGPVLSDYLQITTLDLHLGAHVNVINANSEPLKIYADVLPDDHTSDRESRYIRILLHFRSPGMRAFPQKLEEDYELRFEVRRDGTWDYAPEEISEKATEKQKEFAKKKAEEIESHFSFDDPEHIKFGSEKYQKKLQKRVTAPNTSFFIDPTITADELSKEQIDDFFQQIIDLAVQGKVSGAETALQLFAKQAELQDIGLGFLLATRLKDFGITTFPRKFLDNVKYEARPVLEWINETLGAETRIDQVIDLIITGKRKDAARARSVLDREFGVDKHKKINFLVKAVAHRGIPMAPPPSGVTLRELFASIYEAYRKSAPETTVLPKPKVDRKSQELIHSSEDPGLVLSAAEWCRKIGTAKSDQQAADFFGDYITQTRSPNISEAMANLLRAINFNDSDVILGLEIASISPDPEGDMNVQAVMNAIKALRSSMARN